MPEGQSGLAGDQAGAAVWTQSPGARRGGTRAKPSPLPAAGTCSHPALHAQEERQAVFTEPHLQRVQHQNPRTSSDRACIASCALTHAAPKPAQRGAGWFPRAERGHPAAPLRERLLPALLQLFVTAPVTFRKLRGAAAAYTALSPPCSHLPPQDNTPSSRAGAAQPQPTTIRHERSWINRGQDQGRVLNMTVQLLPLAQPLHRLPRAGEASLCPSADSSPGISCRPPNTPRTGGCSLTHHSCSRAQRSRAQQSKRFLPAPRLGGSLAGGGGRLLWRDGEAEAGGGGARPRKGPGVFLCKELCLCGSSGADSLMGLEGPLGTPGG